MALSRCIIVDGLGVKTQVIGNNKTKLVRLVNNILLIKGGQLDFESGVPDSDPCARTLV